MCGQRAAKTQDTHFHQALFLTLVDLGATGDLLALDTPGMERYLRSQGGLSLSEPDQADACIGPLEPSQVHSP